jgi:ABC-type uncharacterized transport system involved in gliding motility auxiliary subunit
MRAWWAVVRSETGSFFNSSMAPLVATGFLLLTGFSWINSLLDYSEMSRSVLTSGRAASAALNLFDGVFQPLAASVAVYLLMMLPAVTMRLLADEFRSRRSDLILTWPVPDHVWILGKASSALMVALFLLLATVPYGLLTIMLGSAEVGPLLTSLLGLVLTSAMAVTWGVFFSGLASHQLVGWMLAFVFAMFLQTIGHAEPHLPPVLGALARDMSLPLHLERLTRGVIDLRDLVYFAGWIMLGLIASSSMLTGRRLAGARRGGRWLPVIAVAGLAVVAGMVVAQSPASIDLTRDHRRSLAPQTVQVLSTLRKDVKVTAFYQRLDPGRRVMEDMLETFGNHSDRFSVEVINPDIDLARVTEMGVTVTRTVVVEADGRRRTLLDPDELTLINAIFRVVEGRSPVIAYLLGHGEPDLDGEDRDGYQAMKKAVQREGYFIAPLVLRQTGVIPPEVTVVILAGPDMDLAQSEVTALHAFVARGGALLALLDPGTPPSVNALTQVYNVSVGNDFLISGESTRTAGAQDPRVVVLGDYPDHDITRGLQGMATFFPFAQSLSPVHEGLQGVSPRSFLVVGPDTWAERDSRQVIENNMRFDEGVDRPGPIPFGVALEVNRREFFQEARISELAGAAGDSAAVSFITNALRHIHDSVVDNRPASVFSKDMISRLAIVGDSDFIANSQINLYGNRDLLLNTLGWLTGEQDLIARRARERGSEPLVLDPDQVRGLGLVGSVVWPLLVGLLLTGRIVWRRRR